MGESSAIFKVVLFNLNHSFHPVKKASFLEDWPTFAGLLDVVPYREQEENTLILEHIWYLQES